MSEHALKVPRATASLSDATLDTYIAAASRAEEGHTLTDAEAATLITWSAAMARELRQRRAVMELIQSNCQNYDNVHFLQELPK